MKEEEIAVDVHFLVKVIKSESDNEVDFDCMVLADCEGIQNEIKYAVNDVFFGLRLRDSSFDDLTVTAIFEELVAFWDVEFANNFFRELAFYAYVHRGKSTCYCVDINDSFLIDVLVDIRNHDRHFDHAIDHLLRCFSKFQVDVFCARALTIYSQKIYRHLLLIRIQNSYEKITQFSAREFSN